MTDVARRMQRLEAALGTHKAPPVFCPIVYRDGDDAAREREDARHRHEHGEGAMVMHFAIVPARRQEETA